MKKTISLLTLTIVLVVSGAFAQKPQRVIGSGEGAANFRVPYVQPAGTNVVLSKDTVYILTGWYFVDSLATMTIQAGTVILGDSASGGTLIIRRGGKIIANGAQTAPIVFTSRKAAGTRRPGDWGGVIILGNAPTNKPTTQQVEGGFGTIVNTAAMYGGPDPNDSSGVLRYVRVEFAGIAFAQDNEINGLTLGGVGRKTAIDHVQVSYANDDDYEFFGGTVDAKYLVSWRNLDDCLDTDFGYSGRVQFAFIKRDPQIFDASSSGSSNGFESDNEGSSPYSATPRTSARFSNITLVGPAVDSNAANALNSKWDNTAMLRRATELSIYNSILVGWKKGINLRDTLTQRAAIDGRLEIRNTSIAAPTSQIALSSSPSTGNINGFDAVAWFNSGNNNGATARQAGDVGIGSAAFVLDNSVNPVPAAASEGATAAAAFNAGRLNGDTWFTSVSYRGAFDPSKPMSQQWTAGWTNFDPQNTSYLTGVEEVNNVVPVEFSLAQNFPNPFNPATTIAYDIVKTANVKLAVYDLLGQEVATIFQGRQDAGRYETVFNASQLSSGAYFYALTVDGVQHVKKMLLAK